ncbi:MAG: GMC family oxidoreductase N-terminal domain-containing protein [Bacteroidia bacterium]|nr:GMC family oxidoreductase N-terminal domain-containing protein [Bacteroidia bacterium]
MVDYIIVGGGTAGCVLANRLSEDPELSVLLIEAGPEDKKREIHIPAAFSELFKTDVDWAYESVSQPDAAGRKLFLPRGKVMGGCSSINAMIYIRGHRLDYDHWADEGNQGWSYDDLLPYFRKSESNARVHDQYHGSDGPLSIVDLHDALPLSHDFVKAATEAGAPANDDFNGEEQDGFGLYQVTQQHGKRMSAAVAFIKPIRGRKNLRIVTGAMVECLLWEGKKVVGVQLNRRGHVAWEKARQEVILAAGAYNSPQLLLLSGIGPAAHLQEMGIAVKSDLPGVGHNLQDHLIVPMVFDTYQQPTLQSAKSLKSIINYVMWSEGPLSSNVAEAGGFIRTRKGLPAPDIQFHFGPGYFYNHGFGIPTSGYGYSLGPTLLQPNSTGTVTLASPQPQAAPRIDHQYLADEEDLQTLVRGFQYGMKIADSPTMRKNFRGYHLPKKRLQEEGEIADHIRQTAQTLYHPTGTAKMGHDHMAVVDDRLRVKGVEGLRVVDASVMPNIVRGNTNAAVMVIAERAADLLKADRQAQKKVVSIPARREVLTTEQET